MASYGDYPARLELHKRLCPFQYRRAVYRAFGHAEYPYVHAGAPCLFLCYPARGLAVMYQQHSVAPEAGYMLQCAVAVKYPYGYSKLRHKRPLKT